MWHPASMQQWGHQGPESGINGSRATGGKSKRTLGLTPKHTQTPYSGDRLLGWPITLYLLKKVLEELRGWLS